MELLNEENALYLEELMESVPGMDPICEVWGDSEGRYEWITTDSAEKPVLVSMSQEAVSYGDEIMTYRELCLRLRAESEY